MSKLLTIITSLIFTGSFATCGQGQGNNNDIKIQVMDTSKNGKIDKLEIGQADY